MGLAGYCEHPPRLRERTGGRHRDVRAKAPIKVFNNHSQARLTDLTCPGEIPQLPVPPYQQEGAQPIKGREGAGQCTAAGGGGRHRFQPGCTATSRDGPGGTPTIWALGRRAGPAGTGSHHRSRKNSRLNSSGVRPFGPRTSSAGAG
jgi:hypothetical protein